MTTHTAYEAATDSDGVPIIVSRECTMRKSTVRFTGKRTPDVYTDGSTAASYGTVCAITDCDFTTADAWARYAAAKEIEVAGLIEDLDLAKAQLASAKENLR